MKDNIKEIKYHKKRILDDKSVKRVLLFSAPTFDFDSFDIDAQRKAGAMIYHPIGLPMLAAVIREDSPNIEMKICDAEYETVKIMFETNQKEDVLKKLVEKVLTDFKPDLVGISVVFSPGIKAGFEIASMTRAFDSNIIISFGGVHCTFDYENILKEDFADVVFLYESEITFSGYIKYLNGMEKVESIRGIVFLNEKEEIVKIPYESPPDFDALPIPAWDLLDTTNYYKVSGLSGVKNIGVLTPKPKGIINTVRGCVARCTFCSVRNFNGFGVRMREPEDVLNEIDILYNDYGIRYLEVVDDDFSFDHDRSVAICKGLIERNYDLLWSLDNGIRLLTITEELAESLVGAGCRQISVGVESGNAEIMHRIKKPLTIPGLFKKMEMMKQFPEIYVKGNFIVGFPFENYDQLQDTFRIATEVDFDWRIFSTYSPLVGTEALNYFDDETKAEIDYSENSFGSCETIPDGFSSEDEFRDKVYLENLRINFLENPNYKGKNLQRALNDFTRIVRDNDADHALALYCIHNIYKSLGETNKHAKYLNQFNEVINNSAQWRVYCDQLNVPISIA